MKTKSEYQNILYGRLYGRASAGLKEDHRLISYQSYIKYRNHLNYEKALHWTERVCLSLELTED